VPESAETRRPPGSVADSSAERRQFEQRLQLRPALVYEIIRREGEHELDRGFPSLWWSGLAAGLSMGFSPLLAGILLATLPESEWAKALSAFGYCMGFIIVVLGRQQLFTENTITALLPVINERTRTYLLKMLRLWGIVLLANLTGALAIALMLAKTPLLHPANAAGLTEVSRVYLEQSSLVNLVSGIVAGWLIAALVWAMPSAPHSRFALVVLFTWVIGLGHFAHIVAGAVSAFYLVLTSEVRMSSTLVTFLLPALAGNVIGGSALFTLISYAQVREEVEGTDD
jgi:formate/nitrite transporter FocA (FNT family)